MLRAFMYKFLCEHKFSFFWDKLLKNVITGPYGRYMFSFVKNKQKKHKKCLSIFQSAVPFYIPIILCFWRTTCDICF